MNSGEHLAMVMSALESEAQRELNSGPSFRLVVSAASDSRIEYGLRGDAKYSYEIVKSSGKPTTPCRVTLAWEGVNYPTMMVARRDGIIQLEAHPGVFLPNKVDNAEVVPQRPDYYRKLGEALEASCSGGLPRHGQLLLDPTGSTGSAAVEFAELIPDDLTQEQGEALALALGSELTVIQGRPGVGKSFCLARTVAVARMIGYRVLVTGRSRELLEGVFPHIVDALSDLGPTENALWAASGPPHSFGLDEAVSTRNSDLMRELATARAKCRESASASDAANYLALQNAFDQAKRATVDDAQTVVAPFGSLVGGAAQGQRFDVVIVESASQANLAELLLCACATQERLILFADPDDPFEAPDGGRSGARLPEALIPHLALTGSHVEECAAPYRIHLLEQHRMDAEVERLVAALRPSAATGDRDRIPSTGSASALSQSALVLIDTSDLCSRSFLPADTSHANPMTAMAVTALARLLVESMTDVGGASVDVCATSPYWAQCALVGGCSRDLGLIGSERSRLLVGSVRELRNREGGVVLYDTTLSAPASRNTYRVLRGDCEVEVTRQLVRAISRTKSQFVLLADVARLRSASESNSTYARLLDEMDRSAERVSLATVVERLGAAKVRHAGMRTFFSSGKVSQLVGVMEKWGLDALVTHFYAGLDLDAQLTLFDALDYGGLIESGEFKYLRAGDDQRSQAVCIHPRGVAVFGVGKDGPFGWLAHSALMAEAMRGMSDRQAVAGVQPRRRSRDS